MTGATPAGVVIAKRHGTPGGPVPWTSWGWMGWAVPASSDPRPGSQAYRDVMGGTFHPFSPAATLTCVDLEVRPSG